MTDRELLEAFLEQSGLGRREREGPERGLMVERKDFGDGFSEVRIWEGEGYGGFFVAFQFDSNGKLDCVGVWE